MKRLAAAFLSASCAMYFLGGCGSAADDTEVTASSSSETAAEETGKIAEIKKAGVLVMGTASGYPPYEFVSMENVGDVIGIDVAFGQAIADELGVELKVQDMVFSELITSLAEDKCDIAIAGMKETEERAKTIDFSDVYISDEQCMIIRKEDADLYTDLEDFTGKRIGVEMGSSSEELAKTEIPEVNLNSLAKIADLFMELKNGKIDGIVTSRIVGRQYVVSNDDLTTCDTVKFNNSEKKLSCGIAKGNEDLVELVNEVIKKCQDDGSFDAWIEEYSAQAAKEAE